jgi:hypothetical protein
MLKQELIKNSPLRILEQSAHGGVGQGNIGVLAARQGVGKTACLVHIATDQLFQGKHVIHVSFAGSPAHIISWYEDIFSELARRLNLTHAMEEHDQLIKNRVIMNFNQAGASIDMVTRSLRSMIRDGGFAADVVIVDGYDFEKGSPADLAVFKNLAGELGLEIWFSASLREKEVSFDAEGVPTVLSSYMEHIAVFVFLRPDNGIIRLELRKDHNHVPQTDLHLKLDPKILLITGEK